MKNLKSSLIILLILATFVFPMAASAVSNPTELETLTVSVWPEYDKTSNTLLMYRGQLPKSVKLPAKVTFLLPKTGQLSSTSSVDDKNEFQYTKEWNSKKVSQKGDFNELTYNVNFHTFQFEVYDQVDTNKAQREYKFPLKLGMDVKNLAVEMQQPLRSSKFSLEPENKEISTDQQGFKFAQYDIGKIKAGETKEFVAKYSKSDTDPSLKDGAPQPVDTSGGSTNIWMVLITVGILLGIIGGGAFWFSRSSSVLPAPKKKGNKNQNYCNECGTRIEKDSQFCPSCGKKVKK